MRNDSLKMTGSREKTKLEAAAAAVQRRAARAICRPVR